MNLRLITQLFNLRDLRNAIVGLVVVGGGILLSVLTLYSHEAGDTRLAGILAAVSLVFVLLIIIFVVPPLARNAGREAEQMNLPFEFTTGGTIMFGLLLIVGFSAWNTGNNLLFLVLSFLIAGMFVGFFAGRLCLKRLDVKMRFPETIFAGETTPILVSLHNRKRFFASYSVVAEVRGRERERSVAADQLAAILPRIIADRMGRPPIVRRTLNHFVRVGHGETDESRSEHVFPRRGRLMIKDFELSTRYPFGFFRHRKRLPARETELIVFPPIEPYVEDRDSGFVDAGHMAANKRGRGSELLALRDYQPNDDLRRIDWKATARTRNLTVREFSAEDEKRVTIILDTFVPEPDEMEPTLREKLDAEQKGESVFVSQRFEKGVNLAASIASYYSDQQAEIRLVIDGEAGEFGMGRTHLYEILKNLAVVEPKKEKKSGDGEQDYTGERMQNDQGESIRFLITANGAAGATPEFVDNFKIIGF